MILLSLLLELDLYFFWMLYSRKMGHKVIERVPEFSRIHM